MTGKRFLTWKAQLNTSSVICAWHGHEFLAQSDFKPSDFEGVISFDVMKTQSIAIIRRGEVKEVLIYECLMRNFFLRVRVAIACFVL